MTHDLNISSLPFLIPYPLPPPPPIPPSSLDHLGADRGVPGARARRTRPSHHGATGTPHHTQHTTITSCNASTPNTLAMHRLNTLSIHPLSTCYSITNPLIKSYQ